MMVYGKHPQTSTIYATKSMIPPVPMVAMELHRRLGSSLIRMRQVMKHQSGMTLFLRTRLIGFRLILLAVGILVLIGLASASDDLYIYPSKGQTQAQQDKDRYECHSWAVKQTGFDPSRPSTTASTSDQPRPYQPSQPHVVKGAARGAALGAVGGAITGNTGKGAAAGAAMGGLAGGFKRRDERRQQAVQQQSQAQSADMNRRHSYNRAMAACLQGRGYNVN
jgi:hypothetical protein